ncbi:MAG: dTDP-4-dehydrorhamnose reductase family protein [Pyrinomonadaceae bacterium]
MRVLIFGANGMLGHKLAQVLSAQFDVWTAVRNDYSAVERFGIFDRARLIESVDVTNIESVFRAIDTVEPDVVLNAAGIVKQRPEDAVQTLKINSVFPQLLADISSKNGFRLITISTDCVFSGEKGNYAETDIPDARDVYGISKLLGEVKNNNCLTIRTSIIGRELAGSYSLVEWFLGNREKNVEGYVKAIYSGFPTVVLSEILSGVITDHPELHGVYHVSSDPINKFELLSLLNKYYKANIRIEPSEDFVIDRSLNSSAFRKSTGFSPVSWEKMIEQMAADPTLYEKWRK